MNALGATWGISVYDCHASELSYGYFSRIIGLRPNLG